MDVSHLLVGNFFVKFSNVRKVFKGFYIMHGPIQTLQIGLVGLHGSSVKGDFLFVKSIVFEKEVFLNQIDVKVVI